MKIIRGVYTITNKVNGKMYLGSTVLSFKCRWGNHKNALKHNRHSNDHLQSAVNLYGIENFEFEVLQECEPEFCLSFEQYWRNMLRTHEREFGYDICYVAGNTLGYKHTAEVKAIKASLRGADHYRAVIVLQFTKEGEFIKEWPYMGAAAKELNISVGNICNCCRNRSGYRFVGGFVWKYK